MSERAEENERKYRQTSGGEERSVLMLGGTQNALSDILDHIYMIGHKDHLSDMCETMAYVMGRMSD